MRWLKNFLRIWLGLGPIPVPRKAKRHDPNARVFDHTASQTVTPLMSAMRAPIRYPGMGVMAVPRGMTVELLAKIEVQLPNDAKAAGRAPHPEDPSLMLHFYRSESFPQAGPDGEVAEIKLERMGPKREWVARCPYPQDLQEESHAEQELEAGPHDGQSRGR